MSEPRAALLIATSRYDDPSLPPLEGARTDVDGFAEVLGDPHIGGFDVHTVIDREAHEVAADMETFLQERQRNELILVYITGHGVKGMDGRLYFAARNTNSERLRSTAVAAAWVSEALDACRSSRQLLLLDCCHSGAFVRGMTVKAGSRVGATEQLAGRGRVIITASDAVQFALERGAEHRAPSSVFTGCVVRGLRTGEADIDADGRVTLHDLFDYVQDVVHAENPDQTPQMTAVGLQGEIVVAHNPHADARTMLPAALVEALGHPYAAVRRAAVDELRTLLASRDRVMRTAALTTLHEMTDDDSRTVAAAARGALDATGSSDSGRGTGVQPAKTPPAEEPVTQSSPEAKPAADHAAPRSGATATREDAPPGPEPSASRETTPATPRQHVAVRDRSRAVPRSGRTWIIVATVCVVIALVGLWLVRALPGRDVPPSSDTAQSGGGGDDAGLVWTDAQAGLGPGAALAVARVDDVLVVGGTVATVEDGQLTALDAAAWWETDTGWERTWDPETHESLIGPCDRRVKAVAASDDVAVGVGHEGPELCGTKTAIAWWDDGDGPELADIPSAAASWMNDVAWDDRGGRFWAVGAARSEGMEVAAVWSSEDGRSWTRGGDIGGAGSSEMVAVERTSAGLIAVGHHNASPASWRLDRDAWALAGISRDEGSARDVVEGAGRIVAVGFVDAADTDQDVAVWSSSDAGVSWAAAAVDAAPRAGDQRLASVAFGDGFVATSRNTGANLAPLIWTSADGDRWSPAADPAPRSDISMNSITAVGDRMVVGGSQSGPIDPRCRYEDGCEVAIWLGERS